MIKYIFLLELCTDSASCGNGFCNFDNGASGSTIVGDCAACTNIHSDADCEGGGFNTPIGVNECKMVCVGILL